MKPDRFEQVSALFEAARQLRPEDRPAWLRQACGDDHALIEELGSLLDQHEAEGQPLEQGGSAPIFRELASDVLEGELSTGASHADGGSLQIPGYQILDQIGEGGMGTVYEARQLSPQRTVALKVLRPGSASRELRRRFEREQEALARLQHPGIAQIFDAGVTESSFGQLPFYVMERIHGKPPTSYADEHKLGLEERLLLLAKIGDAVQHAHHHGVIHRDLKPSNILVDETGQPKVLDFGVARVTESDVEMTTLETDVGQLVGTLSYMSPEQASGDPAAIDMRSDVYSLGVVAYELLSGELPHDVDGLVIPKALRVITEEEATPLGRLQRSFRGDIETIVAKALQPEKELRYPTIAAVVTDIRRYLRNEPIVARPPSSLYQIRKLASRHRTLVGGILAVFAVLVAAVVVSSRLFFLADARAEALSQALYAARISQASTALDSNNLKYAQELLDSCPEELRHWEWRHLATLGDGRSKVMRGHGEIVSDVDIDAPGNRAVSTGHRSLRVWDLATGRELQRKSLLRHSPTVIFSPDGTRIAYGDDEEMEQPSVHVWNPSDPDETPLQLLGHTAGVLSVAFHPSGNVLASAGRDKTIRLWDLESGETTLVLTGHHWQVNDVAFSEDGRDLFSAGEDGTVKRWDLSTGRVRWTSPVAPGRLTSIAVQSGEDRVVTGCGESIVILWDATNGEREQILTGHAGWIYDVEFSPDGRRIFSACYDATINVWHTASGERLLTLRGHTDVVHGLALSPSGGRVLSASADNTIRMWEDESDPWPDQEAERCVAHWTFDDDEDIAFDEYELFDGTVVQPRWIEGPVDGALAFDGNSTVVEVPENLGRFEKISVSAWFRFDRLVRWNALVMSKGWLPHVLHYMVFDENGDGQTGVLQWSVHSNSHPRTADGALSQRVLEAWEWYHTVTTYDSSTGVVQFYINGEPEEEQRFDLAHEVDVGHPDGIHIGGAIGISGPPRFLDGAMDDLCIYNYVLDPDEVRDLFELGDPSNAD